MGWSTLKQQNAKALWIIVSEGIPLEQGLRHCTEYQNHYHYKSEGIPLEQGLRPQRFKRISGIVHNQRVFH